MNLFNTPDPPDPRIVSGAQTASNVGTAIANANLNNVNQVTPFGNLSWDQTGTYNYVDPATGANYAIPRFTSTQTLPYVLDQANQQNQFSQYNLAATANEQSNRLRGYLNNSSLGQGLPYAGNPDALVNTTPASLTFGDAGTPQFGFGDAGQVAGTFGDAGQVQGQIGYDDNFSADRQRVEDSLMARMNPQLAIERNRYEQQLADQGIRYGSPAYENAMRNYSTQANDARFAAVNQAGQEQARLFGMATTRGEFANKAQQQRFEQAKARGEFGNEAQAQYFQELMNRGQFYNTAQQQLFGQQATRGSFYNAGAAQNLQQQQAVFNAFNASRQQALQEQFALRNQPINELTALMSGSQVSHPNFINANMPTIPTTDIAGILNRNFDQQLASSQQQSNNINNIIGGLFGFAGNVARSDRNVKDVDGKIGSVWATNDEGEGRKLPIYSYTFKDDPTKTPRVGPMAQDVEKLDQSAVVKIGGVRHIRKDKMGDLLRAA